MIKSSYTDEQIRYILQKNLEGCTHQEVADLYLDKYGEKKTSEAIRKTIARYQDYDLSDDAMLANLRATHNARKGRSKVQKENKLLLEKLDQIEELPRKFEEILKTSPIKVHKPVKQKVKKRKKIKDRTIVMHLSDTHFQAMIDAEEMGNINSYTNVEEARRLAFFTREVANYKLEHRADTDLVIAINGDILQGIIHDQEHTPLMTTQIACGLHLLSQCISYLANEFKSVRVLCTVGNHARFMHKSNKGRQSQAKWDSFATILHIGLKYALASHENVEFEIPATPYVYTKILGHNYLFLHSDTVLSVGYPGKSINTGAAKDKINDLKEGIGPIDVVSVGHVHCDTRSILNNGVTLITNGSMSGLDPFALSIGITANNPTQQMWEVTKEHAVGDLRSVYLSKADKEKGLDQIIEPFKGKF